MHHSDKHLFDHYAKLNLKYSFPGGNCHQMSMQDALAPEDAAEGPEVTKASEVPADQQKNQALGEALQQLQVINTLMLGPH